MTFSRDTNTVLDPSVPGGDTVKEAITKNSDALDDLVTDLNTDLVTGHTGLSSGVHGVTGDVVGTSDTQSISNKSFSISTWTGGTISNATITSSNATITGGTITGITDLAVADGGTGASTAAGARSSFGLGTAAIANTGTDPGEIPTVDELGEGAFADAADQATAEAGADNVDYMTALRVAQAIAAQGGPGSWSSIGSRSTVGSWVLSGLTAGQEVKVIIDDNSSGVDTPRFGISGVSGTKDGAGSSNTRETFLSFSTSSANNATPDVSYIANGTSITITVSEVTSGVVAYAYTEN